MIDPVTARYDTAVRCPKCRQTHLYRAAEGPPKQCIDCAYPMPRVGDALLIPMPEKSSEGVA